MSMDRPSQRSNSSIPTSSSGVIPPSSSTASPLAPPDFQGSNSICGRSSVNVTVNSSSTAPAIPTSTTAIQASSNKATLETMAQNTLQGISTKMKLMTDAITEQTRQSFSIEYSSYKVNHILSCNAHCPVPFPVSQIFAPTWFPNLTEECLATCFYFI